MNDDFEVVQQKDFEKTIKMKNDTIKRLTDWKDLLKKKFLTAMETCGPIMNPCTCAENFDAVADIVNTAYEFITDDMGPDYKSPRVHPEMLSGGKATQETESDVRKIREIAENAIYFADNSDYRGALGDIVKICGGDPKHPKFIDEDGVFIKDQRKDNAKQGGEMKHDR